MPEYAIEIPPLYYFSCKNDFTGSSGEMSFKIASGELLKVSIWYGRLCFAKADILESAEFSPDDSGYHAMREYLDSKIHDANCSSSRSH